MMAFLTAASVEDLSRNIAETAMRLGRQGAVLDAIELRQSEEIIGGAFGQQPKLQYVRFECQLHYHWAAIDEATHRPGMRQRQQQSVGGAG